MHVAYLSQDGMETTRIKQLCTAFAVLVLLALAISAYAQTDTGAIVGIVQDKGYARIPAATVDVTDTATGVTRSYVTSGQGEYQALQLIPGVYSVTVKHAGFQIEVRQNITLNVQDRIEVDFSLGVSADQQQVVVNENTVELQTQSAEVNGVMP